MNTKQKIYRLVAEIPQGRVTTYGEIAKKLNLSTPRIVGHYLHQNTDAKKVPCHRVVFADGSLSKSYAFGGLQKQRNLLKKEGVVFRGEKVDFRLLERKVL